MRPKIYSEEIIELCKYKHYPANKIFQLLQDKHPSVGQATVYRTLKYLTEKGLLVKLKGLGPCAYYETSIGSHGHAIDQKTGKVYDFEIPKNLLEKLDLPKNLEISKIDIKLYGKIS